MSRRSFNTPQDSAVGLQLSGVAKFVEGAAACPVPLFKSRNVSLIYIASRSFKICTVQQQRRDPSFKTDRCARCFMYRVDRNNNSQITLTLFCMYPCT